MDRIRAMKTLIAIAESGSLSAAARDLGDPLTNISRQLAQLEEHLGCTLVNRTTRRMVFTPEGQDYLITARIIIEDIENAEACIRAKTKNLSGKIAITAPVHTARRQPVWSRFLC